MRKVIVVVLTALVIASGVIDAQAAAPQGTVPAYVIRWAKSYNVILRRAHRSYRILAVAHCRSATLVSVCVLIVHDKKTGATGCFRAAVSRKSQLWVSSQIPCKVALRSPSGSA